MKKRAVSLIALICALGASSVQAETVAQAIEKCRNTDNSLKRLVCYDNVAKSLRQYEGADSELSQLPALTASRPAAPSSPRAVSSNEIKQEDGTNSAEKRFGIENRIDPSNRIDSLTVSIVDISEDQRGKQIIEFNDGSIWKQADRNTLKLKKGQMVTIERGMLGAFFLGKEGVNKRMKVKRLK